ncbi:hypothetical protein [Fluviispira multicolorata]|uniref:Uncharacterized protein n=1 Tax=Fluviispira multicolorata TaxID=2654512 RepID=A0A833JBI8_9BACT|nr:hypothetical protein [Fluviispira multicolorata]KAB8028085.1 hypothetical protein GCL57_13620 [Fluviispira multicolorata]
MKIKLFFQNLSKCLLLILSIFFTVQSFAAPPENRIDGPIGKGRCVISNLIREEYCQKLRKLALETNCINHNEYDSLVKYHSTPMCDRDYRLVSWCPCDINKINSDFNFDLDNSDIK